MIYYGVFGVYCDIRKLISCFVIFFFLLNNFIFSSLVQVLFLFFLYLWMIDFGVSPSKDVIMSYCFPPSLLVQVLWERRNTNNASRPWSATVSGEKSIREVFSHNGVWLQGLWTSGLCFLWWMEGCICKLLFPTTTFSYETATCWRE